MALTFAGDFECFYEKAQQPERDVPSVGMFRVPQSVNCSVRRLFGYILLFCAFLRTK